MSLKLRRNCCTISTVTTTVLLVLFTTSKYLVNGQHDFQFENENNDDLQVIFSEPIDVEKSTKCSSTESQIVMSLVLSGHSWTDIVSSKRQRALKKLANFFTIPKDSLVHEDISKSEIHEMAKHAMYHGQNLVHHKSRKLGRVQFTIGCGKSLFPSGKLIASQIDQQMKDGVINEITGLNFGYWSIWTKEVDNRVTRARRQAEPEGSGEDEYETDQYDDEYEDEDESVTEQTLSHPHRHHHGDSKPNSDLSDNVKTTETGVNIIDLTPSLAVANKKGVAPSQMPTTGGSTTTNQNTYEDTELKESVTKLEMDITKTIENNKKVVDVVLPNKKSEADETIEKILSPDFDSTVSSEHNEPKSVGIDDDYVVEDVTDVKAVEKRTFGTTKMTTTKTTTTTTTTTTIMPTTPVREVITSTERQQTTIDDIVVPTTVPYIETINSNALETAVANGKNNRSIVRPDTGENYRKDYGDDINFATEENVSLINSIASTQTTVETDDDDIDEEEVDEEKNVVATPEAKPLTPIQEVATTPPPIVTSSTTTPQPSSTVTEVTATEATVVASSPPLSSTTEKLTELITVEDKDALQESIVPTTTDKPVEPIIPNHVLTTPQTVRRVSVATQRSTTKLEDDDEENYDDEYDDDLSEPTEVPVSYATPSSTTTEIPVSQEIVNESALPNQSTTIVSMATTQESTQPTTTPTTATTTTTTTTTTEVKYVEPINNQPMIKNRLPKQPVTAGKPFSLNVDEETFYDHEDGTSLLLEMFDKNEHALKPSSWIQFNAEKREIYGLPLEDAVSRWQYKLRATDSAGLSATETFDIIVQQHKAHRSANHEITIGVKLNKKFENSVDWQIRLIRGIAETAGDSSMANIVVREIRFSIQDPNSATFVYTNETLPKDRCPEEKLDELLEKINVKDLSRALAPEITVKAVNGQQIGPCMKPQAPKPTKPTQSIAKNFAPVPRNQVDRVEATVNQLLVFKVPSDTFYDPEDQMDLALSLTNVDGHSLDPQHWLQFDAKNHEFYGIPKPGDLGHKEYLLVAKDREGLGATDALTVIVNPAHKRDYSVLFEMTLGIPYEHFNHSLSQRRFFERIGQVFNDPITSHLHLRSIRHIHHDGNTLVTFYNTTLHRFHQKCPDEEIEVLRNILLHNDGSIKDKVRDILGNEFNLLKVGMVPVGTCQGGETPTHDVVPIKQDEATGSGGFKDDYLLTFVLPAAIILLMLFLAFVIACALHRRRMTGKMELGDEEERRSFRSKGIPVIFQDELDEKPEIGNKSPVILKDEKPPLLPPSYTSTNPDDDDLEEYIPPPGLNNINGRESRGKSPVTPSYRKPPPYVSP